MTELTIRIKKLHKDAKLPYRAHPTDSGADLFALEETILPPHSITNVHTGICIELPENTSGIIWGKSSIESRGIKAMAGLIDAHYRGELIICLYNLNATEFVFEAGQKVAQLVVLPTLFPSFTESNELTKTDRGDGRFGSTGTR